MPGAYGLKGALMGTPVSGLNVKRLIMVPALIALAVTIVRLVGEVSGGPSILFNRAAGGGGALVGIVWLIPILGIYFGVKLVRGGFAPESAGKVIGFAVLGLLAAVVIVLTLTGDPNVNVSFAGAILQQLVWAVASLVAVLILRKVWPAFFRIMLCYAFASRIPVLIVMFIAILGSWGTHYELGNSSFPEILRSSFTNIHILRADDRVWNNCCAHRNFSLSTFKSSGHGR